MTPQPPGQDKRQGEPWPARAGATILEILVVLSIIDLIAVIAPRVIGQSVPSLTG